MYGIFTYIYHKNQPNVGKYTSPMDGMGNSTLPKLDGRYFWTSLKRFSSMMIVVPGDFRPSLKLTVRA